MQVSTKVFNDQALARFGEASKEIQNVQARIATGKNLLRASDDPVAAVEISFAKDKQKTLLRFQDNIARVKDRLELTEISMTEMQNILTRIYELTIQAKNDTYSTADREAIRQEILTLKDMMVTLGNTQDSNGDAIFAGYKSDVIPFKENEQGVVQFFGDQGVARLQISETLMAATAINGVDAFMRVNTETGYKDVFSIVDGIIDNMGDISTNTTIIGEIKSSLSHFSNKLTEVGSLINLADLQNDTIEKRRMLVTEDLSELADADLSQLVTTLQSLLLNRDASQQSFALIGQQSLFDYLR
ncbi:flagellar hook-associated protein FlgL [Alphaproteobacteria bacterium LSUCC0684]